MIQQKLSNKLSKSNTTSLDIYLSDDKYAQNSIQPAIAGVFFDLYDCGDSVQLVSKIKKEQFGRDNFWKQRNELLTMFEGLGYACSSEDLIDIVKKGCLVSGGEGYGVKEYYQDLIDISHNQFIMKMKDYFEGEIYLPENNRLGTSQYSHINLFSWIYYNELKVIKSVADDNKLNVLEVGSSFGNSILSKNAFEEKMGFRADYYGVDIEAGLVESASNYAKAKKLENINFHQCDALNLTPAKDFFNVKSFEVITSSHLLEHLEDDPSKAVSHWFDMASRALVLSVPFDCKSSSCISEHKSHFDKPKLIELSDHFKNNFKDCRINRDYADSGMLIFYKGGY